MCIRDRLDARRVELREPRRTAEMGVHEESRAGLDKLQRILFHKRIAVEDLVVLLPLGKRLTRMVLGLVVDLHTPRWRGELELSLIHI